MLRSSNESDSYEDEYLSNQIHVKAFKNKQNFEKINKTDQIKRKRTVSTFTVKTDNLITCKKKFVNNNNIVDDFGYVSKTRDLKNNKYDCKQKNESIHITDRKKIGKIFKSGSKLNVVNDIQINYKQSSKSFHKINVKTDENTLVDKNENKLREYLTPACEEKENFFKKQSEQDINVINNIPSKLSINLLADICKKPTTFGSKRKFENNCSSKISESDTINTEKSISNFLPKYKKLKKPQQIGEMSVYDRRYQSDERPTNSILSRVSSQHNDENASSITNQYYPSSTMTSAAAGIGNITAQPTIATLCNIGNTCYLNSVVYTLRFAPLFLHNLHHLIDDLSTVHQNIGKYRAKSCSLGRNVNGLHMENARSWSSKDLVSLETSTIIGKNGSSTNFCDIQKSSQQIATEKLHELYQNLHKNEILDLSEPFHADTFLHAIQDVSSIFEGNQQQDAHEFLMCVLNNIRETCQSLIKSISECPDVISNGYISLPEPSGTNVNCTGSSKDLALSNNNSSTNTNVPATTTISQTTSLIKTSFFSRKSKRKDDGKNSKNLQLRSPLKDNTQLSGFATSSDLNDPSNDKVDNSNINDSDKGNLNINITIFEKDDNVISTKEKENRLAEKIKKLGLDFFTEDFEGITVSTTKCLSCETVTEQKETMIDIAVPISGFENADFTEKSHSFIQNSCITREYFRGENKYRCEQCIGYTEAIRSISYEVLPRLLVIQLSRFSGGMEKINSFLPTPFTLQCFCSKCYNKSNDEDKLHIYKLYSVITHVGATMSVGHYIAYTCSLDWANEYSNCPKERQRHQQNQLNLSKASNTGNSVTNTNVVSNGSSEKNIGLMKKMFYGRNKASSSGDMSKSVKNVNGVSSKIITNGVEKLKVNNNSGSNNFVCQSMNCCGTKLKTTSSNTLNNTSYNNHGVNGSYVESIDDNSSNPIQNSNSAGGYSSMFNNGSTIYSGNGASGGLHSSTSNRNARPKAQNQEPIWYMCDDDKIKAMTQREFEDLLSPNRKIMITPYLLFYARKNFNNEENTNSGSSGINVVSADE